MKPKIYVERKMLKRIISAITFPAALAGCATTADLRATQPVASGETRLAVKDFVACVQERWINNGADRVNYIPKTRQSSLTSSGPSGVEVLLDVDGSETGSSFVLYSRLAIGETKFIIATESCK